MAWGFFTVRIGSCHHVVRPPRLRFSSGSLRCSNPNAAILVTCVWRTRSAGIANGIGDPTRGALTIDQHDVRARLGLPFCSFDKSTSDFGNAMSLERAAREVQCLKVWAQKGVVFIDLAIRERRR